jgi:ABC-type branched-subunit amino acid transport system substrate-binding protein
VAAAGLLALTGCGGSDSNDGQSASPDPKPEVQSPAPDTVETSDPAAIADPTAAAAPSADPAAAAGSVPAAAPSGTKAAPAAPKASASPKPASGASVAPAAGSAPAAAAAPAPGAGPAAAPAPGPAAPAGGNGGATDVGVTDTEIKMGGIFMYGMPLAKLFISPMGVLMKAAVQGWNDAGGIYGRKIKYVDCDDGFPDPARTRACYKKLVEQDKVFSFLGGATWVQGEIMPDLNRDRIPWLAPVSLYRSEWESPWSFPIHMGMEHEAHADAQWALERHTPITKFGLLCLTTAEMQASCDAVTDVMTKAGAKMVQRINTDIDEADASGQVLAMRAAAPDHIFHYTAHPAATVRFMLDAAQQDYWPPKGMSGNHMAFEAVGGFIGDYPAKKGYWTNTTYKLWGPDFIAWNRKFIPDNEGHEHHVLQGQWFGLNVAREALQKAGPNLTREGLKKVMESQEWATGPGLGQKFMWEMSQRGRRDLGSRSEYMYRYVNSDTRAASDAKGEPPGMVPDPDRPDMFKVTDTFD